jgi:coenzyme F420-reducing hydrogenase alpha subunit
MRIRIPQRTLERLEQLFEEKNPLRALEGAVDVINNYARYEGETPVRYSETTGKPVEFKWKPYQEYRPEVQLEYDWDKKKYKPVKEREQIRLNQEVLDFLFVKNKLETQTLEFRAGKQNYALAFRKEQYEASSHNDRWLQTDLKIIFSPVKKLDLGGK